MTNNRQLAQLTSNNSDYYHTRETRETRVQYDAAQFHKLRWQIEQLRMAVGGYDKLKKEVHEAILNISLEYERRINELKYQLENTQERLENMVNLQAAQQEKAAELLHEKQQQVEQLHGKVKVMLQQNQLIRDNKKAKQQSDAKVKVENAHQIDQLNLRINDLLQIIHEKTQQIEIMEERQRRVLTARQAITSQENILHQTNMKNLRQSSAFGHSSATCNKPYTSRRESLNRNNNTLPKQKLIAEQNMSQPQLTLPTSKHDTQIEPGPKLQNDPNSEIITRLQKFVNELTTSHNMSMVSNNELTLIDKKIEAKYTHKQEYNTLRARDNNRRHSSYFLSKK